MIRSVLKSLLKPESYPEPTTRVDLVQTHVSWIFLTDSHAYKIKKPVDFSFLNFSSIDRRRFYCNEEVKYNRRLCPDIYEGVVELRQTPTGFGFFGNGQIIDYAVKMKRLPAEGMLDRLIRDNAVSAAELRAVARVIADFHQSAPTSPSISEFGRFDRIVNTWNENFELTADFENSTLPAAEREFIKGWITSFCDRNSKLFEKRICNGYIRECDGDIHLENICLVNETIYIFDCIEFSDRLRCCDTASDIAFLLMDLDFHGRRDLAAETIAAYHEATGDDDMFALIDFYKIYRAFVRGKVESLKSIDTGMAQQERATAIQKAIKYFRLARGYIERCRLQPTIFITCGLMGCGKSTLADQLSFELGISSFNSDIVRKRLAGISSLTTAAAEFGEGLYTQQANEETYNELLRLAELEILAGSSVIIDACFIRKSDRTRFAAVAKRYETRFVIIHVSCSEPINRRRLSARFASGRSVSAGRVEFLSAQRQMFEPLETDEGIIIPIRSITDPSTLTSMVYERLT